jgi:AcrR family transcriptional regulator
MRTKTEERRRAILEVAAAAFSELGVEATTMSEIVARLGGSKSTIYGYFPSKAELVSAVAAHTAEAKLQQVFHALDPEAPLRDALIAFGKGYLRNLLSPHMLSATRIAQHEGERSDQGRHYYEAGPLAGWRQMERTIRPLIASGKLRAADAWVATLHLKGLLQAELLDRALFGYAKPSGKAIDAAVERAIDVYLRAYGPPPKRAR